MASMQEFRQYYKQNTREFWIIAVSALLGVSLVAGNTLYYQSSTALFSMDTETIEPRLRTVDRQSEFQTVFGLQDPAGIDYIAITIRMTNISDQASLSFSLNNDVVRDEVTDLSGTGVITLTPKTDTLGRRNVLTVSGTFRPGGGAVVQSVSINGYDSTSRTLFLIINLLGLVIAIGPGLGLKYYQYRRRTALEDRFPDFLRDVVEGTRSGMSLPQAIKNTQDNNYGVLSQHVEQMSAKLDWGIPFDRVLNDFADDTDSQIIRRAVNTINQTYQSGGNVSNVLESVGSNLKEIKKLRRQRESELYGEMVTGYVVYFIFLAVMVMLVRYLVPALSFNTNISVIGIGGGGSSTGSLVQSYRPLFRNLIIIQAVFSGLVIGQLTGGDIRAGARHVAVLLIVGYLVSIVAL